MTRRIRAHALRKRKIRRRWWLLLALTLLAGAALVTTAYLQPFWLVERMTDVYLFRHGVHHREIVVNNHRIHYLEAAPSRSSGRDRPIVLVHGLGARASDWAALTPTLAEHGYHVYALDLLGYGRSDKPFHGDASLSTEERIVSGFIEALGLKQPDVAGWSMGGWIAAKLALDEPDKVRRLLLFDSAGLYMQLDFPPALFSPTNEQEFDELVNRIEPDQHFIHMPSFAVPGLLRRFQSGSWYVNSSLESMLSGREILDFRLRHLRMPVLIVWGTQDHLIPVSSGVRMHELVPQSVLVELQGCGHLAIAECASTAIPPVIRFLYAEPPLPAKVVTVAAPKR